MTKLRIILLSANVLLLIGFVGLVYKLTSKEEAATPNPAFLVDAPNLTGGIWDSHKNCQECHPIIYDEWQKSMHIIAWTDPHVQLVMKSATAGASHATTECRPCHLPAPVFEKAQDELVKGRTWDEGSGVNCLTCHKKDASVIGPGQSPQSNCNAVTDPFITTPEFCAQCHRAVDKSRSLHEYEEWLERSQQTIDKTCIDCHMREVERPIAKGGPIKKGHSHWAYVSKNPKIMRSAFDIKHEFSKNQVKIGIVNTGTAHRLPTGRMRMLYMTVQVKDKAGKEMTSYRETFAKPATPGAGESTQLLDGETQVFTYPLEGLPQGTVTIEVFFKAMRYDIEDLLEPLFSRDIKFSY
ncbi:multiheme c-type cytochrome [Planctomycetota bacterium]